MPYKSSEKQRERAEINYYKNRKKRILYQRKYDKIHKDKKNLNEMSRRRKEKYNLKKNMQHYSQKIHLPFLMKEYGKCQICGSKNNLQIHHKKYTKKIEDCLLMCLDCHKEAHRKYYKL